MTKKKRIVVVLATLLLLSFTVETPRISFANSTHVSPRKVEGNKEVKAPDIKSFADQGLPVGDIGVTKKMDRFLKQYAFDKIKTNQYHEKADEWFPVIEPILKQYDIPEDFKFIPLVESALVEEGTSSHRGASGYWQFMPATARAFGLQITAREDERLHLKKSTVAAAKYLRALYRDFGNWTLVAAAYNVGGGSLRKSMRQQSQKNYYKLKLNQETGAYLYKLIAVKEIIEKPSHYGFDTSEEE